MSYFVPDEGDARDVTDWVDVTVNGQTNGCTTRKNPQACLLSKPLEMCCSEIAMGTGYNWGPRLHS